MTANYYKYNATMGDRTYFTSVVNTTGGKSKRYFSNIESEIYFGNKEMEDIYQFEFGIDEKILPIYGYNCFYATELVSGNRIVQGQFVVNYTDSKMIQSVLSSIDDSIYREISDEDYFPGGDLHHAIYDKQFDIMIGYGYYNVKDKETYNATSQTIIGAKISGMHKVLDTTGQPILEVFTFMAKDFIEENITLASTGSSSSSTTTTTKDKNKVKFDFVFSDLYNAGEIEKNSAKASESKCEHFIYNLTYAQGLITFMMKTEDGKDITLVDGSVEITDTLSSTTLPVLDFTSVSKSSATIQIESKYSNLILNNKDKNKLNCTITCKIKMPTSSGTVQQQTVKFEDAILHI